MLQAPERAVLLNAKYPEHAGRVREYEVELVAYPGQPRTADGRSQGPVRRMLILGLGLFIIRGNLSTWCAISPIAVSFPFYGAKPAND